MFAVACCAPYVYSRLLLAVIVMPLSLLVVTLVVVSCWLSGGNVESSVSVPFYTRAHTLNKKKKKKIMHLLKSF
jgi:hypothetical protein